MSEDTDTACMARLWGRVAQVYDTAIPFFSALGRHLVDVLDLRVGEYVLDVATGRGACLFPAAERVGGTGRVVGFDLSSEMVTETAIDLSRGDASNLLVLVADAQHLAFASESFDVVTCSQAIGQFPDPTAAARELRRVLRSGGRIGVQRDVGADPRWEFTTDVYRAYVDCLPAPPEPKRRVDVVASLEGAGFVDVERRESTLELVFPDEQAWWDWAWTTGAGRRNLDPLPDEARAQYRDAVVARMQHLQTYGGFPMELTIECVLARR